MSRLHESPDPYDQTDPDEERELFELQRTLLLGGERMSHVQPVPTTADVRMTVTADVRHLCPFVPEVDHGTVTVTWHTNGATLELHWLREYLNGFKDSEIAHEMLTDRIRHDLSIVQGVELVSVESTWDTAGMEVQCSITHNATT